MENASRTEIRLAVGLNSKQISRYLHHLVSCGVLRAQRDLRTGRDAYIITSKGERLIELLAELANTPGLETLFDMPP